MLGNLASDADIDAALQQNHGNVHATVDALTSQDTNGESSDSGLLLSASHQPPLTRGQWSIVKAVKAVLGCRFSNVQIKEVLAKNRNSVDFTINELLGTFSLPRRVFPRNKHPFKGT